MRILKKVTDEFWWDVAGKCDYATFYHTPIWKELGERTFPGKYRDETFGAILPSGVRVVFPLMSTRRLGPFRWLVSSFDCCYGGFIADGPVLPAEAIQIYKHAYALPTVALYMSDNPLGPAIPEEIKSKFNPIAGDTDLVLNLDADFDVVFSRFKRSQRNAYRKGIQSGVQIRLASSLDDYRAYYTNYQDAVERWGEGEGYGYSWERIAQVYEVSQRFPEQIKLWLMIVDEQIVGGRLVFYWGQHATGWMGTAHRDFLKHNVTPVADIESIRDAIAQGYRYFDFSGSNQKQGVEAYKLRFDPMQLPVSEWLYEHPLIIFARTLYKSIRERTSNRHPKAVVTSSPKNEPEQTQPGIEAMAEQGQK